MCFFNFKISDKNRFFYSLFRFNIIYYIDYFFIDKLFIIHDDLSTINSIVFLRFLIDDLLLASFSFSASFNKDFLLYASKAIYDRLL